MVRWAVAVDFQPDVIERFWEKVRRGAPDICWPWQGAVDKDGYGVFGVSTKVKSMRAHRVAFIITYGDPGKLQVLHKCDNPPCCNPRCLFEGTPLMNMRDKLAKGRHVSGTKGRPDLVLRGEEHPNAILTDDQVRQIREGYVPRKVPLIYFAEKFGVAISTVHYALATGRKSLEMVTCP